MAVVCYLVNTGVRGGNHQEESVDKYGRRVETVTKQLIGNVREFMKHCCLEDGKVE